MHRFTLFPICICFLKPETQFFLYLYSLKKNSIQISSLSFLFIFLEFIIDFMDNFKFIRKDLMN